MTDIKDHLLSVIELRDKHNPKLPEVISLQNQGELNCVSTCLAMLTDMSLDEVTECFHNYYMETSTDPQLAIFAFLHLLGLNMVWSPKEFVEGGVYMVTVGSLNMQGYNHQILVDYRNHIPIVIDPQRGKRGKNYYVWGASEEIGGEKFPLWIRDGYYFLDAVVYE